MVRSFHITQPSPPCNLAGQRTDPHTRAQFDGLLPGPPLLDPPVGRAAPAPGAHTASGPAPHERLAGQGAPHGAARYQCATLFFGAHGVAGRARRRAQQPDARADPASRVAARRPEAAVFLAQQRSPALERRRAGLISQNVCIDWF